MNKDRLRKVLVDITANIARSEKRYNDMKAENNIFGMAMEAMEVRHLNYIKEVILAGLNQ